MLILPTHDFLFRSLKANNPIPMKCANSAMMKRTSWSSMISHNRNNAYCFDKLIRNGMRCEWITRMPRMMPMSNFSFCDLLFSQLMAEMSWSGALILSSLAYIYVKIWWKMDSLYGNEFFSLNKYSFYLVSNVIMIN